MGYQSVVFALMTKSFAMSEGFLPNDPKLVGFFRFATLERGLLAGAGIALAGCAILLSAVVRWQQAGFGALDYSATMKWVIPGATMAAIGVQTVFFSFLVSMTGIGRK